MSPSRLLQLPFALVFCLTLGSAACAERPDWQTDWRRSLADVQGLAEKAREMGREAHERALLESEQALAHVQEELETASLGLAGGRARDVVKNAPFTADVVYEKRQVLADGNRIVKKTESTFARDGVGRTRQQRGPNRVIIDDPIAGRTYLVRPESRLAVRVPRTSGAPLVDIVPPAPPVPPMSPTPPALPTPPAALGTAPPPAVVREIEVSPGRVVVQNRERDGKRDVHVEVIRIGRAEPGTAGTTPHALPEPMLPPLTLHGQPLALATTRGEGATESLAARDIEGVRAEGTRTTYTLPAGAIGNEKPIVTTSERWFSPELHVVVLATTSDPRTGETMYRLSNIRRGEPPADLFRVPSDFKTRGDQAPRSWSFGR